MKYYNTELWQLFHDRSVTHNFIGNEKEINSHNFDLAKNKLELAYGEILCKNCKMSAFYLLRFYINLTCEELMIKRLLE